MAHLIQSEFDVRCEWGLHGVELLAPISDVVVIVDVLSFSTCVDIATADGAAVFPYRFNDDSARDYARARGALLAGRRGSASEYSLSSGLHRFRAFAARRRLRGPSEQSGGSSIAADSASGPDAVASLETVTTFPSQGSSDLEVDQIRTEA